MLSKTDISSPFLKIFLMLCLIAETTEAGECCLEHTNVLGQTTSEKWCSNYCCSILTVRQCCDNVNLRTDQNSAPLCVAWLKANIWVPVLIGVGGLLLLLLITCCCCCCCACCRNKQPRTVVVQGQQTPNVVVSQQTQMNPLQMPYDQNSTGYMCHNS